jgi:hypothetical protein
LSERRKRGPYARGNVERWAASAWLLTEKNFRRIDGHKELWTLAALLGREIPSSKNQKVA